MLFSPAVSPKHGEEKNVDDHVNSCGYDDAYSHTKKRPRKCSLPISILSTKGFIGFLCKMCTSKTVFLV